MLEELKKRLAEILAKLDVFKALESYTEEQETELNGLYEEFNSLTRSIEAKEKLEVMAAAVAAPNRKTVPVAPTTPRVEVGEPLNRGTNGFKSGGEFFKSVVSVAVGGKSDPRLFQNSMLEKYGEDGAFLIPTDFRTEIWKKVNNDQSLLGKAFQLNTSSNNLSLPLDELAAHDASGIKAYWEGEESLLKESKHSLGNVNLRLHKLTALVKVTSELMEDAPAIESWVKQKAPEAFTYKINQAMLSGDGVGKPTGILNSGFKVKITKEGGQAADTIVFENINNMFGSLLPTSIGRAAWYVNPQILPQLRGMAFKTGAASPVPAYLPPSGLATAPYGTLMGLPIVPMIAGVRALGDEGDIILADFSFYLAALRTNGIKADVSTHVYFDRDLSALRFIFRMAGEVPFKSPVVTEYGNFSMSGIVTLEDR